EINQAASVRVSQGASRAWQAFSPRTPGREPRPLPKEFVMLAQPDPHAEVASGLRGWSCWRTRVCRLAVIAFLLLCVPGCRPDQRHPAPVIAAAAAVGVVIAVVRKRTQK